MQNIVQKNPSNICEVAGLSCDHNMDTVSRKVILHVSA